jgi:hypothetical protein
MNASQPLGLFTSMLWLDCHFAASIYEELDDNYDSHGERIKEETAQEKRDKRARRQADFSHLPSNTMMFCFNICPEFLALDPSGLLAYDKYIEVIPSRFVCYSFCWLFYILLALAFLLLLVRLTV